jgi:hypothetical protein
MIGRSKAFWFCAIALALAAVVVLAPSERDRRKRVLAELDQIAARIRDDPSDPKAIEDLLARTSDPRGWDRTQTYAYLSSQAVLLKQRGIFPEQLATSAIPRIRTGLRDPDPFVQREAAQAARELAPRTSVLQGDLQSLAERYPERDSAQFAKEALSAIRAGVPWDPRDHLRPPGGR